MIKCALVIVRFQKCRWFLRSTFLCVSFSRISSAPLLTMALFSWLLLNLFLGKGWLTRSLVGLSLAYLAPKPPRTLYSSEEWLRPWIRHILDLRVGRSTYSFLCLSVLSLVEEWGCDEADSPLFCLMWPSKLASALVSFYRKVIIHLHK